MVSLITEEAEAASVSHYAPRGAVVYTDYGTGQSCCTGICCGVQPAGRQDFQGVLPGFGPAYHKASDLLLTA